VLLGRILRNLLSNALRYTERGGVLVGIRRRGDGLRVAVWDTGPGIHPDQQKIIFEEFRQIGNPERGPAKGQGLGLAIVAKTADLLGHRLTMRSRVGRGSMFAITLPLAGAPAVAVAAGDGAALGPTVPGQPATILVVEDNHLLASLWNDLLTAKGYRVVAVPDLATALAALPPCLDLIISDYRLPGVSGIDGVLALRQAAAWTVPAIIVTGDTQAAVKAEALRAGCEIIQKPFAPRKLLDAVARCLPGPAAGRT
jgi:CheY-like chemotaxis protein